MSQLADIAIPFPDRFIKKNPSGGGTYVPHYLYAQRLLIHLGHYDYEMVEVLRGDVAAIAPNPNGKSSRAKEGRPALSNSLVGVVARLTVIIDGERVVIEDVGDCEEPHNWPHDGARMKDAMSDALKRCCARIGLGLHLYCDPGEYQLRDTLKKNGTDPAATIGAGEGDAEPPQATGHGAAPESAPPPPPDPARHAGGGTLPTNPTVAPPEPAEPDPVPSFIDPPDNPDAKDAGKPLPQWLKRLHVLTGETLGALPTAEITEKRRLICRHVSGETKSSRDLTGDEREGYEEVLTQLREGTLEFVVRANGDGWELRRAVGGQDPATAPAAPALDLAGWKALAKAHKRTQGEVVAKARELSGEQEPSSLAGLVGHRVAGGVLAWLEGS